MGVSDFFFGRSCGDFEISNHRFRTSSRMIGTASRSRAAALATALTRQRPKIESRTIRTTSGKKGIFGNDGKTFINSWPAKGWTEEFDKFHACDKNLPAWVRYCNPALIKFLGYWFLVPMFAGLAIWNEWRMRTIVNAGKKPGESGYRY